MLANIFLRCERILLHFSSDLCAKQYFSLVLICLFWALALPHAFPRTESHPYRRMKSFVTILCYLPDSTIPDKCTSGILSTYQFVAVCQESNQAYSRHLWSADYITRLDTRHMVERMPNQSLLSWNEQTISWRISSSYVAMKTINRVMGQRVSGRGHVRFGNQGRLFCEVAES